MVEGWTLVAIMIGGGFGAGYATSQMQVRPVMVELTAWHLAEIGRMQAIYQDTLKKLGDRTLAAANTALNAANTAEGAANSAEEAVNNSEEAIKASKKKPERVKHPGPSESARQNINHSIDKANRAIR